MIPELLRDFWPVLLALVDVVLAGSVTIHAVLRKRETRSVIAWVGLAWLAPIVGSIAYFCFGVNRIQRLAVSLQIGESVPDTLPEVREEDYQVRDELLGRSPNLAGLAKLGRSLTNTPILPGNAVRILREGDEAYPAMLDAIANANSSVALLSYIFDSDQAGERFFEALKQAKERGVEVRVLIDHVGSRYSKPNMIGRLKQAGIPVAAFLPTRTPWLMKYANLRNHRKILVVDGCTGFTGGTNIRESHWHDLNPDSPVRCVHFGIDGPVVDHLQRTFTIDWAFATGEVLSGERWFPHVERAGVAGARGVPDGPDEDLNHLSKLLLAALSTAQRSVRITSPYFLPEQSIVDALCVTALRGVDVDIVVPSKNNITLVQWAMMGQLEALLENQCGIWLSPPPFDHSKLFVIDGVWSLIGSTNWDPRSLRLNFEFNVECYDSQLAEALEELIDEKIAESTRFTIADLRARSFPVRLRDGLARLASPYL